MATERTDVVIVGVGAAGAILAAELAKGGMRVIGLERGPRHVQADFKAMDELRFFQRVLDTAPGVGGRIAGDSGDGAAEVEHRRVRPRGGGVVGVLRDDVDDLIG